MDDREYDELNKKGFHNLSEREQRLHINETIKRTKPETKEAIINALKAAQRYVDENYGGDSETDK